MTVVCLSVVMGGQEAKSGKIDLVKMLDFGSALAPGWAPKVDPPGGGV